MNGRHDLYAIQRHAYDSIIWVKRTNVRQRTACTKLIFQFKRSWNTLYTITTYKWKDSWQPGSLVSKHYVIATKASFLSFHFSAFKITSGKKKILRCGNSVKYGKLFKHGIEINRSIFPWRDSPKTTTNETVYRERKQPFYRLKHNQMIKRIATSGMKQLNFLSLQINTWLLFYLERKIIAINCRKTLVGLFIRLPYNRHNHIERFPTTVLPDTYLWLVQLRFN